MKFTDGVGFALTAIAFFPLLDCGRESRQDFWLLLLVGPKLLTSFATEPFSDWRFLFPSTLDCVLPPHLRFSQHRAVQKSQLRFPTQIRSKQKTVSQASRPSSSLQFPATASESLLLWPAKRHLYLPETQCVRPHFLQISCRTPKKCFAQDRVCHL